MKDISLKSKLIFCILLAEIIILSVSSVIIILSVTSQQEEIVNSNSVELCKVYANQFDGDFRENLAIARTLSATLTVYETKDRDEVVRMLEEILEKNSQLVGTYVCYEPDMFDGRDSQYVGTDAHDETGRFLPYVTRSGSGIRTEPLYYYDTMDYYQIPLKEKRDALTEPLYYNDIFVLSIVSPIFRSGEFIGIGGVDVALDYVNTTVNQVKVFDSGYAYMISNNGMFLSHPTDASFIGEKGLSDLGDPLFSEAAVHIKQGLSGSFRTQDPLTGKDVIVFYEPVRVDNSSVMLIIPVNEMMAGVHQLTQSLIVISLISILFILGVSYFLASWILSPIDRIVNELQKVLRNIAAGNLNGRADTDIVVDFRPIPEGINDIIDAVMDQVHEAKRVSYSLELGHLGVRSEKNLTGEFKEMTDALSGLSRSLDDIINDSTQVLEAVQKKDFSRSVHHYGKGDFRHLTEGIEQTRIEMGRITEEYERKELELNGYMESLRRSNQMKMEMERIINSSPVIVLLLRIDRGWPLLFISENVRQWGYSLADFKSGRITYFDLVHPDDRQRLFGKITRSFYDGKPYLTDEFRIITRTGETRWVETRMYLRQGSDKFIDLQGVNLDITERKKAEQQILKTEELRKKEIHHRVKNNLQVISTMLYLEASKFTDPEILQAFKDSQSRVKSMALIHEELYKGQTSDLQTINFKSYVEKLADNLFRSYKTGNNRITFDLNIIEIYLNLETSIPLGTIINELVTNSLKYAFKDGRDGRIWITMAKILHDRVYMEVGDDGKADPKSLDLYDEDRQSMGLQFVLALVDQIDGEITQDLSAGTRYRIIFPLKKNEDGDGKLERY